MHLTVMVTTGSIFCGSVMAFLVSSLETKPKPAAPSSLTVQSKFLHVDKSMSHINDLPTTHCELEARYDTETGIDEYRDDFEDEDDDENQIHLTEKEEFELPEHVYTITGSESLRYEECLAHHRKLLPVYLRKWAWSAEASKTPTSSGSWPRNVASEANIATLERDLAYCNVAVAKSTSYCNDLRFRIASYYIRLQDDLFLQRKGYKLLKELAEDEHPDGQCMYGMVLNEGIVQPQIVEINPSLAVVWWRRAAQLHRHVQATYELAVALYTGEGCVENEELAVHYFRLAANLGHAGAAYMLGDCLLDGVGVVERDRAEALEWLVTAGEWGHRGARSRVLAVLQKRADQDYGGFTDASRQTLREHVGPILKAPSETQLPRTDVDDDHEDIKWTENDPRNIRTIERRYSVGGGSRNPVVLSRRKSVVAESRK